MEAPNLSLTVKTATGKTVIMLPISFDVPDDVLGLSIRQFFAGAKQASVDGPVGYVVVERS